MGIKKVEKASMDVPDTYLLDPLVQMDLEEKNDAFEENPEDVSNSIDNSIVLARTEQVYDL